MRSVVVKGYLRLTCRVTALSMVVVYCVAFWDWLAILYSFDALMLAVFNSDFLVIFEHSSKAVGEWDKWYDAVDKQTTRKRPDYLYKWPGSMTLSV